MLNNKQQAAIKMSVYQNKTDKEICEELKINHSTLWRWRQTDEFNEEVYKESKKKFKGLQQQALYALEKLLQANNFNAVKYVLDGCDYAPSQKIDLNSSDINIKVDGLDD